MGRSRVGRQAKSPGCLAAGAATVLWDCLRLARGPTPRLARFQIDLAKQGRFQSAGQRSGEATSKSQAPAFPADSSEGVESQVPSRHADGKQLFRRGHTV